ncbi:UNVERIFIED_CONTAM: hypothetical protein K2H54_068559 [Gekko kuhli]
MATAPAAACRERHDPVDLARGTAKTALPEGNSSRGRSLRPPSAGKCRVSRADNGRVALHVGRFRFTTRTRTLQTRGDWSSTPGAEEGGPRAREELVTRER